MLEWHRQNRDFSDPLDMIFICLDSKFKKQFPSGLRSVGLQICTELSNDCKCSMNVQQISHYGILHRIKCHKSDH